MANPAELLHKLLMSWSDGKTASPKTKRSVIGQPRDNKEAWAEHRRAVRLLNDVEEALEQAGQQGHNVKVFDNYLPAWTAEIFAFPHGWDAVQKPSITRVPMEQLQSAAVVLDVVVPEFKEKGQQGFDEYLTVLDFRISQLPDEQRFLREHALRIVNYLRSCLKDLDEYGEFRIVNALSELQFILDCLNQVIPEDDYFAKAREYAGYFFKRKSMLALVAVGITTGMTEAAGTELYQEVVAPYVHRALEAAGEQVSDVTDALRAGESESQAASDKEPE